MKRVFEEIPEDDWTEIPFNPSRVLNNKNNKPSSKTPKQPRPSIESFAYTSTSKNSNSDDDCVDITDALQKEILEDDDFDEAPPPSTVNRGRRFIIEDDEDDWDTTGGAPEVIEVKSDEEEGKKLLGFGEDYEEEFELGFEEDEKEEVEESDVVGKALQKCGEISEELKRDLYGSAGVRIVTQDDICKASMAEDSGFQPLLKPYQFVGVNFLLFLYRKRIAGAILADEMGLGKTIQAITYLTLLNHLEHDPGPHLIVCLASVLENWERELKKWCS